MTISDGKISISKCVEAQVVSAWTTMRKRFAREWILVGEMERTNAGSAIFPLCILVGWFFFFFFNFFLDLAFMLQNDCFLFERVKCQGKESRGKIKTSDLCFVCGPDCTIFLSILVANPCDAWKMN